MTVENERESLRSEEMKLRLLDHPWTSVSATQARECLRIGMRIRRLCWPEGVFLACSPSGLILTDGRHGEDADPTPLMHTIMAFVGCSHRDWVASGSCFERGDEP